MLQKSIFLFALVGLVAACGSRRIAAVDGAKGALDASTPGTDTCVRPTDWCAGDSECAVGEKCEGCWGDPCCPNCRGCYGKCVKAAPAPMNCAQVNTAYMDAVVQAKTCSPMDPSLHCTLKVWHALPTGCPCPCETFIDPANTGAIKQIKAMEALWLAKKCGPGLPPPPGMACCALYPMCTKVTSGTCAPGPAGTSGCQDK